MSGWWWGSDRNFIAGDYYIVSIKKKRLNKNISITH